MTCRYAIFSKAAFANGASWPLTQAPVQAQLYAQIVRDCGDGAIGPTEIACRMPGFLIVDQRLIWAYLYAHYRYCTYSAELAWPSGLSRSFKIQGCSVRLDCAR